MIMRLNERREARQGGVETARPLSLCGSLTADILSARATH
jgi:hypothetical protein